jgi:hypothetical protein
VGVQFSIKSREAKDRYIDANIKNIISELSVDIKNYGIEIVLRKLLLSLLSPISTKYRCRSFMQQLKSSTII